MRIATFNLQNLRLRAGTGLQGARDEDTGEDPALDARDRALTADLLAEIDADVLALQEVFDQSTLDHFHERCLRDAGLRYRHRLCFPGNDGRGLDVAVMSRVPWRRAVSHAAVTPAELKIESDAIALDQPVFRRDCLEVTIGSLTLFICHFKAPYPDPAKAWAVRRVEALAVCRLVARSGARDWLVIGDLNDPGQDRPRAIAPLLEMGVDLVARLPEAERWTYFDPETGAYQCPDAMIASPDLAARWPDAVPRVWRRGLGRESVRFGGARLSGVGHHRPHASDHAAVSIDLPGA